MGLEIWEGSLFFYSVWLHKVPGIATLRPVWLPFPGLSFCIGKSQEAGLPGRQNKMVVELRQRSICFRLEGANHFTMLIDGRPHRLISSYLSWVSSAIYPPLCWSPIFSFSFPQLFSSLFGKMIPPSQASAIRGQHFSVSKASCLLSVSSRPHAPPGPSDFSFLHP